jgi:hypothetical protein
MLCVVRLNVIMLSVVRLNVVILSAVSPLFPPVKTKCDMDLYLKSAYMLFAHSSVSVYLTLVTQLDLQLVSQHQ